MIIARIFKVIAISSPIVVTFIDKIGYVAKVDGSSMKPCLNPIPGQVDFVVLDKLAVRNFEVKRGDIVSLISPKNPSQKFIKRIIGLEGDVITISGYKFRGGDNFTMGRVVTVPQGHCWVEGDHAASSFDSNNFGPVPVGLITAKATYIVWPPSRWRSLQNESSAVK